MKQNRLVTISIRKENVVRRKDNPYGIAILCGRECCRISSRVQRKLEAKDVFPKKKEEDAAYIIVRTCE